MADFSTCAELFCGEIVDLGLKDRVIVVTGGGAGIGEAITRASIDEGAVVVIVSRTSDKVQHFLEEMRPTRRCDFVEAQLAASNQCRHAVETIERTHGRIDGLVNNAGANDGVGLANGDPERFLESLRQNLLHYYSMAHFALPMLKDTRGAIVNISSKIALTGQGGTSAYAAAKGAQLALTREWAAELLPFGIRVNSILPAEVLTPLYKRWIETQDDPAATLKAIIDRIPLGRRMTEAAEVAATTVFLLSSKQSGHTTAQHLVVDGGYTHLDRILP
jgi:L-fucose dehydrogenase